MCASLEGSNSYRMYSQCEPLNFEQKEGLLDIKLSSHPGMLLAPLFSQIPSHVSR